MKAIRIFFVLIVSLFLSGCVQNQDMTYSPTAKTSKETKPSWIFNPNQKDGTGGVGVSSMHVRGISAQRELAISRAIDEIARQLGVKVRSVLKTSSKVDSTGASSSMESYSFHTVDGRVVSAYLAGMWNDPNTDELYVWMVATQK